MTPPQHAQFLLLPQGQRDAKSTFCIQHPSQQFAKYHQAYLSATGATSAEAQFSLRPERCCNCVETRCHMTLPDTTLNGFGRVPNPLFAGPELGQKQQVFAPGQLTNKLLDNCIVRPRLMKSAHVTAILEHRVYGFMPAQQACLPSRSYRREFAFPVSSTTLEHHPQAQRSPSRPSHAHSAD